jgi:hypothetical protein
LARLLRDKDREFPRGPRRRHFKREAEKEVVPENEVDKEDKDTLLDERLSSVDRATGWFDSTHQE